MIRHLSVRHKVTAIAVATTAIVLVLASAVFVLLEINNYRRALAQELTAIAQITSNNLTAAIMFNDPGAAYETLKALDARPHIEAAAIYTADGRLFAHHLPGSSRAAENRDAATGPIDVWPVDGRPRVSLTDLSRNDNGDFGLVWTVNSAEIYGPIEFDGEIIGAIRIRSNLHQIASTIETYLSGVLIIVLLAIALAWFFGSLLQRHVTQPIYTLLDTMRTVANDRDYSLRARVRSNDELGDLVDGFNDMLAETEAHRVEMNTARQEAESANRLKSDFLAHMSHELRTPLNAILGFSDFMLSEPHGPLGDDNYREYMRDIHEGGHHLLSVINDILDLSKIEAGAAELHDQILDPEEMIVECTHLLRERAVSAGIDLAAEVSPGLPNLRGDEKLLKRGLLNLLSNAIKFTPSGGRVTVRADQEPSGAITLTVIDNGIGIAPQQIEHVLMPFGQAENVMTRSQDGTGLGLPLVKSFIELHGGELDLWSALGEGTKVTLRFPDERTSARAVVDFASARKTAETERAARLALTA